jgi:hypothetical protein
LQIGRIGVSENDCVHPIVGTGVKLAVTTHRARRRAAAAGITMALLVGMLAVGDPVGGPAAMADPIPLRAEPAAVPAPALVPAAVPSPASAQPQADPSPALVTGLAAAAVQAASAAAGVQTELAVAVLDRGTGESAASPTGTAPVLTASLSKVVVAVDILDRRRLEGLVVTDFHIDRLRRALGPSDDSAMNALWSGFDGAGAAGRVAARLGLQATSGPGDPSQWGEVEMSASDTVTLWAYILNDMPAADRDLVISAMTAAPGRAADGFDQAFGLLAPEIRAAGTAAKQGWMCCFSGTYYLHSAGVVGPDQRFVVALLTRQPRGPGWEAARQEMDRIAAAALAPLG